MAKNHKPLPSQEQLKELFDYSLETGELRWKVRPANRVQIGDVVKGIGSAGYCRVWVNGTLFPAHRVIWCWMTGEDIGPKQIDHKNHIRTDNRWSNLRKATRVQNGRNIESDGYCRRENGTFRVRLRTQGTVLFDRTVKTEEEAKALVAEKRKEFYGDYAPC